MKFAFKIYFNYFMYGDTSDMSSIFSHWTLDICESEASIFCSIAEIIVSIDLLMRLALRIGLLRED